MPYSTEVIENGKGILHIGTGMVTRCHLMSSASAVFNLVPQGLRPEYISTDLSGVTDSAVSAVAIEKNATLNSCIARLLP